MKIPSNAYLRRWLLFVYTKRKDVINTHTHKCTSNQTNNLCFSFSSAFVVCDKQQVHRCLSRDRTRQLDWLIASQLQQKVSALFTIHTKGHNSNRMMREKCREGEENRRLFSNRFSSSKSPIHDNQIFKAYVIRIVERERERHTRTISKS